jgi:hypothetical protein
MDVWDGYEKGLYGARKMALLHARNLRSMARGWLKVRDKKAKEISEWLWGKSDGSRDVASMCRRKITT